MKIELDLMEAIHLSTIVLFKAKKSIKNYKIYSYNPEVADIFRRDALQEFKIYKRIEQEVHNV